MQISQYLFLPHTRYFLWIMLLSLMKAGAVWAQRSEDVRLITDSAIVNAGWMHEQAGGIPLQWTEINGVRAEVTGYPPAIDKRIRFFRNHTFEINVYAEPKQEDQIDVLSCCTCRIRKVPGYKLLPVITGTWSVRKDSVYLQYRWECVYDEQPYIIYNMAKEAGEKHASGPRHMGRCRLSERKRYLWRDGRLCLEGITDSCYR